MTRLVTQAVAVSRAAITLPFPSDGALPVLPEAASWRRFLPLWRHVAWLVALFLVSAFAVAVRLDVQQLRKDLDRNDRMEQQAHVLNQRLELEIETRRRAVAVDAVAQEYALDHEAKIVRVEAP